MRIHRLTTSLSVFVLFTVSFCVAASAAENIRFVDVVSIDWNGSSQRKVSVSDVVKSLEETSLPYWNNQVKYSKLDNRIIKLGEVFYREIVVKNPPSCSGNLANEYIRKVRLMLESAESTSSNFDQRYLVVLMPRINCIWEAISTLNTPGMWMGGMLLNDVSKNFIISHELGHALGLGHSNLVACDAGKFDGIWLKECRGIEYGGAVDLMGNIEVNTPLSTYHKWRLGIITNRQVKQNWLNETVILSDTESPDGIRALFIRDVKASYWIEFRKSSLNNLDKPGLVIYRVDPPPASAIYSPNTQDSTDDETDMRVSTDIWMLNLDDFQYSNGVATGSMTLPTNRLFSTFSSNITLSYELLSPDRVAIKIMRKPDLTSPPVPELLPESQWTNPQASILRMGNNYEDAESVISEYEVEMGGTITKISTPSPEFIPNYLSLLSAQKTILFGDLKEGDYMIRVRAVDIWGNKSYWSELKRVSIDKSFPILKNLIYATSDREGITKFEFDGATDLGSGICLVRVLNPDGFVLASSIDRFPNIVDFFGNSALKGLLQIFDCKGNGIESEINLVKSQVDYPRMKKTGKWISHSDSVRSEVLICAGKCTISFSLRNASNIVAFSGEGEIIIDSKEYSRFKIDNHGLPQSVLKKDFGNRSSTVRLSGTNIGIYRPLIVKSGFGKSKEIYRRTAAPEQPVLEMEQKKLSLLGFSKNDFDENWNVIPIAKGTTLESPTLDFCFDNFNSESNRVARRQVVAIKESSPYLFVSTEVVRYKSKVAGIEAQSELTSRIEDCVRNGGFRNADGIFQDYQFLPIEGFNGKYKVIDNGIMLYVKIGIDNSARYLLAYYQFNDGVLSGMYVVKPYQSAFTREELAKWEQIRSKLSFRLLNNSGV